MKISMKKLSEMGEEQAKQFGYKAHEAGKRRDWTQDRNFVLAIPLTWIEQKKSDKLKRIYDAWYLGWDKAYHKGYQDEMAKLHSKQGADIYKVVGVHDDGNVEVVKFDSGTYKLRIPQGSFTVGNRLNIPVKFSDKVVLDSGKKNILSKIAGKKIAEVVRVVDGTQASEAILKSRGIKWEKRTMPRGQGKEIVWWYRGVPVAYWNSISKGLVMGERGTESFAKKNKKIKEARDSFDIMLENVLRKTDSNFSVRDNAVWKGDRKIMPINRVDSVEYAVWKVKDRLGIKPNTFQKINKKQADQLEYDSFSSLDEIRRYMKTFRAREIASAPGDDWLLLFDARSTDNGFVGVLKHRDYYRIYNA